MTKAENHGLKSKLSKIDTFPKPLIIVSATISLYFVAQFIASLVLIGIVKFNGWQEVDYQNWLKASAFPQFIFVVLSDMFMLLGVWLFLRKRKISFKKIGLSKPKLKDIWLALSGYLVYMLMFVAITFIAKVVFPSLDMNQQQEIGFEANKGIINLAMAFISLVVLPPIVEETLVRGYLFTGLRKSMKFIPALIITSLVFGSAHLQFGNNAPLLWVAFLDTFALSVVLVYLREKTGRLAAPMLLHCFKNLIAFSLLFLFI